MKNENYKSAFPCGGPMGIDFGMSLRQWYAGMAIGNMATICDSGYEKTNEKIEYKFDKDFIDKVTAQAFAYADAMITHEEKENEK